MTVQRVLRVVASCALAASLFVACKGDEIPTLPPEDEPSDEDAGTGGQPGMQGDSGPIFECLMPRPGCDCGMEGATYDCRAYYRVNEGTSDEYIACSYGHYLCADDGKWSECIGERIVVVPPDEVPPRTVFEDEPLPGLSDAGP